MNALHRPEVNYVLGHAEPELQRLIRQSVFYAELTEDWLRRAGLTTGMRVLDVGSGAGDISLLAGHLVGPTGRVVGVDRAPQALALARQRAGFARMDHVSFIEGDLTRLELPDSYDALVGRFVLMYMPDPADALRRMARHVRAGGVVAFQEMDMDTARPTPRMALHEQCGEWIKTTFQRGNVEIQMGPKLYATLLEAGLPGASITLGARVGAAHDGATQDYIADVVASLLPMIERAGVATAAEVGVGTLAGRLREEARACDGVMISPSLIGAWTRKPESTQKGSG